MFRVEFTYFLDSVPPKNTVTPVRRKIRTTYPPYGRTEFEGLTETESRTLIFAEMARLKKEYGHVETEVHDSL
jgi:hypothetical protein